MPDGTLRTAGMLFSPGYPGFLRGLARRREPASSSSPPPTARLRAIGRTATKVSCLAEGFDQLYGVAVAPGGTIVVAELGAGRVLSIRPGHVEVAGVRAERSGRRGDRSRRGLPGLRSGCRAGGQAGRRPAPWWTACSDPRASSCTTGSSTSSTPAPRSSSHSTWTPGPGAPSLRSCRWAPPPGVIPKPLLGMPPFSGPQGPFAGIAAGPDGTLYVSADAEGSVLALRRES